ncbi:vegetative incompatibility protein HET-E-1 [Phaeosphaeria sp. MPI-PUGE-AT-0046c]|nr:vegetative incompatibility protein HET-E-1 [Phaeosphaeria sp. MPI-PUGE-AT-0046c]
MRLLKYGKDGRLTITSFDDNAIPPYAILSHTWGVDTEEVTFADLAKGNGYTKICFCGEQAQQDGLQYFWVDTCCIDKSNKAELSHAIQSMFRWYQNATKCYVYLSDVSTQQTEAGGLSTEFTWEPAFRSSRWFTRGWTLQELLAPSTVEFFSQEWEKLGDKISLASLINRITGIPHQVFRGSHSQFDVHERLRWKGDRKTKLKEDMAYSLSGICDVDIVPVYGEGEEEAFRRLYDEIRKLKDCLRDLRSSDPRDDKKRIEVTKGGLLADSYRWVLNNTAFQQWQQDPHSRLLWVKGDPGKGKTMLLCGIINELQKAVTDVTVSYFFCQATDSRINSATAALRGLLYMLVDQQSSLALHVRKKYDYAGRSLFEDANAWVALTKIFTDVLLDPRLRPTYLVIDALDECVTDLPMLLNFVAKQSSASSRVKWIVSSRNWPVIKEQLDRAGHKVRLSLELNADSVAAAVAVFIHYKVGEIAKEKKYKAEVQYAVLDYLTSNANDTFLWVALVCQALERTANRHVLKKLAAFPPGLDDLYQRMMQQMSESDDADICRCVLASTVVLYRPVTIRELVALVEQLEDVGSDVREIIDLCGSFLTVREDTVYFVHQSAKDFLLAKASNEVFPNGAEEIHQAIFSTSLAHLSRTLHRDMYSLQSLGTAIENVKPPHADPLAASRYPCVYWIDHLHDSEPRSWPNSVADLQIRAAYNFLREKYLYWLEGLSLCHSVGKGVVSMEKLWSLVQRMCDQDRLAELIQDARRFIMYHKGAIEGYPLQTYASALLFSPTGSIVRQLFKHEEPESISIRPTLSDGWSACLQTLEGHSPFSHNSTRLASASHDSTVKIWDASSSVCLQTLKGHSDWVRSVAFSHDSTRLASASDDKTIKIWDVSSGVCLQTLKGHSNSVMSVAFSHDSARLASALDNSTVKIWDASSSVCLQTLEGHSDWVRSVAFSHDSTRLASASDDSTVKIWDASSGVCLQTFKGHSSYVMLVAFSHDSVRLASASDDKTVKIWDTSSVSLQTLEGHSNSVMSVAFSHSSARLASASYDSTVKIWDASSGACLQTLKGHSNRVSSVAFSHDSTRLASASHDSTVKIWDASSGVCLQTLKGHSSIVMSVAFSHDSARLSSASGDSTVKIWDTSSGACLQTLKGHSSYVVSVAFSHNSARLASASDDETIKIWDASSGACLQTLEGHSSTVTSVAFSHDLARLASASFDKIVKIWDTSSGACLQTLWIGKNLENVSFDATGYFLHTEIGTIALQSAEVPSIIDVTELERSLYVAIGLSLDSIWIKHNSENMLWIPSEYRPSRSAISETVIGVGNGSGRVWLCRINI